jgi:hypothetical protein
MPDILHNFQSFNSEVHLELEAEKMTPTPPKNGLPVPKPAKTYQPIVRSLYEMVDGKLPDKISAKPTTPRAAEKRLRHRTFLSIMKEAFTTFFGPNR